MNPAYTEEPKILRQKNEGRKFTPQIQQGWSENKELTPTSTTDNYTPSLARARHTFLTKKYTKHSTAESCFFSLSSSPQGTTVRCGLSSHLMQYWKACHYSIIRAAEECTDRGEGRHNANWHSSGFLRNTSKANIPTVFPFSESFPH